MKEGLFPRTRPGGAVQARSRSAIPAMMKDGTYTGKGRPDSGGRLSRDAWSAR